MHPVSSPRLFPHWLHELEQVARPVRLWVLSPVTWHNDHTSTSPSFLTVLSNSCVRLVIKIDCRLKLSSSYILKKN